MPRPIFSFLSFLSLVALLLVAVMWARSYLRCDCLEEIRSDSVTTWFTAPGAVGITTMWPAALLVPGHRFTHTRPADALESYSGFANSEIDAERTLGFVFMDRHKGVPARFVLIPFWVLSLPLALLPGIWFAVYLNYRRMIRPYPCPNCRHPVLPRMLSCPKCGAPMAVTHIKDPFAK